MREKHPGLPLILLGESMGGAVIMAALAEASPPEADGFVLAAPAVWSRAVMPAWQARVLAVDDEEITLDLNHPLAGKTLEFQVEIVEVQ